MAVWVFIVPKGWNCLLIADAVPICKILLGHNKKTRNALLLSQGSCRLQSNHMGADLVTRLQ